MSLYPSLEDMKVDQMAQVQQRYEQATIAAATHAISYPDQGAQVSMPTGPASGLYPSLQEYMGLEITPEMMAQVAIPQSQEVAVRPSPSGHMQVAPITGDCVGLRRAEIKQGVREVMLCKDEGGKMGLRVKSVNKGIFVAFVHKNSPASLAGLRFGDQILQINGENVAGWDTDKAMKVLKNCKPEKIIMAVRDRPFERTITMQKDSTGHIGFVFKEGKITAIVKDSSAARNGILTEHQLAEVNGQNVVGLKDKEIGEIINAAGTTITVTIVPSFIYNHIIKSMGDSLIKKFMDHSIPDV
jgi:syntenin-1